MDSKKTQNKDRKAITQGFKELEVSIGILKKAEKELDELKPFEPIFGSQFEVIRRNIKSPKMARQVEEDLLKLKESIQEYEKTLKPADAPPEPSSQCADIFISYAEEDGDVALEIALGLEEVGYTTWCYDVDSTPATSYLLQTGDAIDAAQAFLLVISPQSVTSRQVTQEVVRAHESSKKFVPVLRGISHQDFQDRQPEWRVAVGAATSIRIPAEGVASIIPRIVGGLRAVGIIPCQRIDHCRLDNIRRALLLLQSQGQSLPPLTGRQKH